MGNEVKPKTVDFYSKKDGKEPFTQWVNSLGDGMIRRRIYRRIRRLEQGNYGDCEPVGHSIFELRLHFGSGYRVYFAERGNTIVVILCGGDKSSQQQDIETAKLYWKEVNENA